MTLGRLLALGVPLLACAGPRATLRDELALVDLQARLAARAASLEGHADRFRARGKTFAADCSGFVEAVYEAEGVPLRRLVRLAAPDADSGVRGAYRALARFGSLFERGWPAPGDLVFFDATYDRDGGGPGDDRLTHVGVVLWVEDGTVVFLHRGGRAVARAVMTRERADVASAGGRTLNTPLREKRRTAAGERALSGALFAAYGRIDPAKLPPAAPLGAPPAAAR